MVTIYGLVNSASQDIYVGCTAGRLNKRMREHRCLLKAGRHAAIRLQQDWNRLTEDSFNLVVLEQLPDDANVVFKRERELAWMKCYSEKGKLYNDNLTSFSPPKGAQAKAARQRVLNGYRPSAETIQKRRLATLGVPKGHGAKISATKRANRLRDSLLCIEMKDAGASDKEPRT